MTLRTGLLLLIALVYISGNFFLGRWQNNFYRGDTNGYYLHLVSAFVYGDVGDYDQTIDAMLESNPGIFDPRDDKFLIKPTEKGRKFIKYTLGVPLMEAPFFLLGHWYARLSGTYPADGWSTPYFFAVGLAIIGYVLVGFYLLIGMLQKHFSNLVVVLTVLTIALATNLFYQATYVTMAHGFLFFNYCLLIYLSERFYQRPGLATGFFIGAVVGLITMARIPELVSGLIPVLWGVTGWKAFRERLAFFREHYLALAAAALGFLAFFSLQFGYWYFTSGQLIFNPYEGEGFNFLKPHILNGWFNFANGWLIYTPIMALSLAGVFFLRRYLPEALLPTLFFVGAHVYIHYSYYVWNYFPGLGSRPMVETYPILAFSLAACYGVLAKRRWSTWFSFLILAFFTWLNLFQTWQMNEGIIWPERHNRAFYLATFGKTEFSMDALRAYDSNQLQPDTAGIRRIGRLYFNDFENPSMPNTDSTLRVSGKYALLPMEDFYLIEDKLPLKSVKPKDWLKLGMDANAPMENAILNRDLIATFFLEFYDENGKRRRTTYFKPGSHIGNEAGSIWASGELNKWGEANLFIQVPKGWNENWTVKMFVMNGNKQRIFLDDLYVDLYRGR